MPIAGYVTEGHVVLAPRTVGDEAPRDNLSFGTKSRLSLIPFGQSSSAIIGGPTVRFSGVRAQRLQFNMKYGYVHSLVARPWQTIHRIIGLNVI